MVLKLRKEEHLESRMRVLLLSIINKFPGHASRSARHSSNTPAATSMRVCMSQGAGLTACISCAGHPAPACVPEAPPKQEPKTRRLNGATTIVALLEPDKEAPCAVAEAFAPTVSVCAEKRVQGTPPQQPR